MSDPKIWNGTAWVRPRFWTGTEWKEYLPPVYDDPMSWDMNSEAACPPGYYGEWHPGGYIFRSNVGGGGILSGVNVGASTQYASDARVNLAGAIGHTIRAEASYSWVPHHASSAADNVFQFSASMSGASMAKFEADYDLAIPRTLTVQTGASILQAPQWGVEARDWSFEVNQNTADFSEPYTTGEIRCDWFRFMDLTTGLPLMSLGFPGWQPFVFNGQKWV